MPNDVPTLPQDVERIRSQIAEDRAKLKNAEVLRERHLRNVNRAGVALKKARRSLRQAAAS